MQAKKKRDSAAVVDLYNTLVDFEDASEATQETVKRVGDKYGINMKSNELEGLKKIYGQYLETIIPPADQELRGDEVAKIRAFKDALGLSDEDIAPVHIDVGRRLSRSGFETKDRQGQFEQRKAFQRLIYVSQLLFGDQKAAFLLPWRRVFNLNDSQLFVARRDNARALFVQFIKANGGELAADRHFLRTLREQQLAAKLLDETCEEVIKDYARQYIEARLQRAVDAAKSPMKLRDNVGIVKELDAILEYNQKLLHYSGDEDLVPGIGAVSVRGGRFDSQERARDVKDVFRIYIQEYVNREGQFTPQLEANMKDLQSILSLSAKEASLISEDIAATLYKNMLREEVTSKRIDEAASPAAVLQSLCERSHFGPESAAKLHLQLYKQKLASIVEKRKIGADDEKDLQRIRRVLCIPNAEANKVMKETAGRVLRDVISDIFLMGAKPVNEYDTEKVEQTIADLKMDTEVALAVLRDVTREKFKSLVTLAQKEQQKDRKAASAILKKLVQFNALVVTPILERVKGFDAAAKEMAELLTKAVEKAKAEKAAARAAAAAAGEGAGAEGNVIDVVPTDGSVSDAEAEAAELAGEATRAAAAAAAEKKEKEKERPSVAKAAQKLIRAERGEFEEDERRGQKEITLKDDLDPAIRAELYKNYLMYSMSGDVVELPVGGVIRKKTNNQTRQAEMSRLQQLSDILGMSPMEQAGVQSGLAEQAFKAQAQEVVRSGPPSPEKDAYLDDLRQQLGIQKEAGDKLIKEVKTQVLGASAVAEEGKWTVEKVLQLSGQGVKVEEILEEGPRRNLYRRELETRISDGKGDADAAMLREKLPAALALDERRVNSTIKELTGSRKRMLLVQAVSQFRQKRAGEAVTSLANLVSCFRVAPEGEVTWNEREELKDLFGAFAVQFDAQKQSELQAILKLSDSEAAEGRTNALAAAGGASNGEDEAFF